MSEPLRSLCCNAPITIGGGTNVTRWYICTQCGHATDPAPETKTCGEMSCDECNAERERLHRELAVAIRTAFNLRMAIIRTIAENRHLADGDNCTLHRLVKALETKIQL